MSCLKTRSYLRIISWFRFSDLALLMNFSCQVAIVVRVSSIGILGSSPVVSISRRRYPLLSSRGSSKAGACSGHCLLIREPKSGTGDACPCTVQYLGNRISRDCDDGIFRVASGNPLRHSLGHFRRNPQTDVPALTFFACVGVGQFYNSGLVSK